MPASYSVEIEDERAETRSVLGVRAAFRLPLTRGTHTTSTARWGERRIPHPGGSARDLTAAIPVLARQNREASSSDWPLPADNDQPPNQAVRYGRLLKPALDIDNGVDAAGTVIQVDLTVVRVRRHGVELNHCEVGQHHPRIEVDI